MRKTLTPRQVGNKSSMSMTRPEKVIRLDKKAPVSRRELKSSTEIEEIVFSEAHFVARWWPARSAHK